MSERDIPSLLQDILEAIGNVKDFTRGITFKMYLGALKTKHAVERNFSIIAVAPTAASKTDSISKSSFIALWHFNKTYAPRVICRHQALNDLFFCVLFKKHISGLWMKISIYVKK